MHKIIILAVTCFPIILEPIAAADQAQPKVAIRLSPVPLWPQNNDTSQLPKAQFVFLSLSTGEFVISYPKDLSASDDSERVTLRFGTHSLVDPQVTAHVTLGQDGTFTYAYQISNGVNARQPVAKITLLIPTEYSEAEAHHPTWKIERPKSASLRDLESPTRPVAPVEWSAETSQPIQPGGSATGFSMNSKYRPGFTQVILKGRTTKGEYTSEIAATLPQPVRDQVDKVLTPAWDSQTRLVLGPQFPKDASQLDIAQNLLYGISVLSRHGDLSPDSSFVKGAISTLRAHLESGSVTSLDASRMTFLSNAKPGLEAEIANALQVDFQQ